MVDDSLSQLGAPAQRADSILLGGRRGRLDVWVRRARDSCMGKGVYYGAPG